MKKLKAPFPFFGTKSKVTEVIWQAFGKLDHYLEPFAGTLSVLLNNPHPCKIETVNDLDCYLINFWRALAAAPKQLSEASLYPVTEADLHARHRYLINWLTPENKKKFHEDVNFYDLTVAAYWVWGISASIGNNWLANKGLKALPLLSCAGTGIHAINFDNSIFSALSNGLQDVRIVNGDYKRILTPALTYKNKALTKEGFTGVFLDPPYEVGERERIYANENSDLFKEVCDWAVGNGKDSTRVIVCGYEGDYKFPEDWQTYHWSNNGGYANKGQESRGQENKKRETIWFSPNCLKI